MTPGQGVGFDGCGWRASSSASRGYDDATMILLAVAVIASSFGALEWRSEGKGPEASPCMMRAQGPPSLLLLVHPIPPQRERAI
jgi:hypothetical protein